MDYKVPEVPDLLTRSAPLPYIYNCCLLWMHSMKESQSIKAGFEHVLIYLRIFVLMSAMYPRPKTVFLAIACGTHCRMDSGVCTVGSLAELSSEFCRRNNAESFTLQSPVPAACTTQQCVLGVDEAGRGPVLGPMVYGVCYCMVERASVLADVGCADSKSLTEEKREQIFEQLCSQTDSVGWVVEAIAPGTICNSMFRRQVQKCSLNQVAQDSTVGLIRHVLQAGVKLSAVYVDTVGPADKYQYLKNTLHFLQKMILEKKADVSFPVVSAASICAKVSRDRALQAWNFQEGLQLSSDAYGSGYPNDPVTKTFLTQSIDPVFGFPQLVRFSWSTAGRLLEDQATLVQWCDDETMKLTPTTTPKKLEQEFIKAVAKQYVRMARKHDIKSPHLYFQEFNLNSLSFAWSNLWKPLKTNMKMSGSRFEPKSS
ncbi:hypothetical protein PR048_023436 [Dryococelus australis]|uniref:Ribonuclease n=1 Tax=Dryococelus australis TaxID=614101 RepID=A0ABQ9GU59_9NEOP|nr:hypothetical protein PR048_023436 [Dryococelus australis]